MMTPKSLKIVFLLIFLFFWSQVFAQDQLIKGTVLDAASKSRLVSSEITNLRTKVTVLANEMGYFQLFGNIGDTLLIQRGFYTPQNIIIKTNEELIVRLRVDAYHIEEVQITGKTKLSELNEVRNEFRKKGAFYNGKPSLLMLSPIGGNPLSFFYELFGKTPNDARRFGKYYLNEVKNTEIDKHFNQSLVKEHTGLEGDALEAFMIAFRPQMGATDKWTHYDAVKHINISFQKYKENPAFYTQKLLLPKN